MTASFVYLQMHFGRLVFGNLAGLIWILAQGNRRWWVFYGVGCFERRISDLYTEFSLAML